MSGDWYPFTPSVEADVGQEIFLPTDPWEMIKSGKIADVPIMFGLDAQESGIFTPGKKL